MVSQVPTDMVRSVLARARDRIADPARWATGCTAYDVRGQPVAPADPKAVRWCAVGAVWAEVYAQGVDFAIGRAAEMALNRVVARMQPQVPWPYPLWVRSHFGCQ